MRIVKRKFALRRILLHARSRRSPLANRQADARKRKRAGSRARGEACTARFARRAPKESAVSDRIQTSSDLYAPHTIAALAFSTDIGCAYANERSE